MLFTILSTISLRYSLEIVRQIPGRNILTALPHPSAVRLGQIIFSWKLPVITVADHYYWPYHSKTRSRVLDSLFNLERYPVYKRHVLLEERKIWLARSQPLCISSKRSCFRHIMATLVPRGSRIFNHQRAIFRSRSPMSLAFLNRDRWLKKRKRKEEEEEKRDQRAGLQLKVHNQCPIWRTDT